MSEQSGTEQWNRQWTATFVVTISLGVSGLLWARELQVIAVAATLLGTYVIYKR